jgi:hypothetical protein
LWFGGFAVGWSDGWVVWWSGRAVAQRFSGFLV